MWGKTKVPPGAYAAWLKRDAVKFTWELFLTPECAKRQMTKEDRKGPLYIQCSTPDYFVLDNVKIHWPEDFRITFRPCPGNPVNFYVSFQTRQGFWMWHLVPIPENLSDSEAETDDVEFVLEFED